MAEKIDPIIPTVVGLNPVQPPDVQPGPSAVPGGTQPTVSETLLTAAQAQDLLSGFREILNANPGDLNSTHPNSKDTRTLHQKLLDEFMRIVRRITGQDIVHYEAQGPTSVGSGEEIK